MRGFSTDSASLFGFSQGDSTVLFGFGHGDSASYSYSAILFGLGQILAKTVDDLNVNSPLRLLLPGLQPTSQDFRRLHQVSPLAPRIPENPRPVPVKSHHRASVGAPHLLFLSGRPSLCQNELHATSGYKRGEGR